VRLHVEQKLPPTNPVACQVEFRYYPLVQAGLIKGDRVERDCTFRSCSALPALSEIVHTLLRSRRRALTSVTPHAQVGIHS